MKMSSVIVLDSSDSEDEAPKPKRPVIITNAKTPRTFTAKLVPLSNVGNNNLTAPGATVTGTTTNATNSFAAIRKGSTVLTKINTNSSSTSGSGSGSVSVSGDINTLPKTTLKAINIPSGITVTRHGVAPNACNVQQVISNQLIYSNPKNGNKPQQQTTVDATTISSAAAAAAVQRSSAGITVAEKIKQTAMNQTLVNNSMPQQNTVMSVNKPTTQQKILTTSTTQALTNNGNTINVGNNNKVQAVPTPAVLKIVQTNTRKRRAPTPTNTSKQIQQTQTKTEQQQQLPQLQQMSQVIQRQPYPTQQQQVHQQMQKPQQQQVAQRQQQTTPRQPPPQLQQMPKRPPTQQKQQNTKVMAMPILSPISQPTVSNAIITNSTLSQPIKRRITDVATPPPLPPSMLVTTKVNYMGSATITQTMAASNAKQMKPSTPPCLNNTKAIITLRPVMTTAHSTTSTTMSNVKITPVIAKTNKKPITTTVTPTVTATTRSKPIPATLSTPSIISNISSSSMLPVISSVHSLQTTPTPPLRLLASPPPTTVAAASPPVTAATATITSISTTAVSAASPKLKTTVASVGYAGNTPTQRVASPNSINPAAKNVILTAVQAKLIKDNAQMNSNKTASSSLRIGNLVVAATTSRNSPTIPTVVKLPTPITRTPSSSGTGTTSSSTIGNANTNTTKPVTSVAAPIKRIQPTTILKKSDDAWLHHMQQLPGANNLKSSVQTSTVTKATTSVVFSQTATMPTISAASAVASKTTKITANNAHSTANQATNSAKIGATSKTSSNKTVSSNNKPTNNTSAVAPNTKSDKNNDRKSVKQLMDLPKTINSEPEQSTQSKSKPVNGATTARTLNESHSQQRKDTNAVEDGRERMAPYYVDLIDACRKVDSSADMERLIEVKLIKYYYSVQTSFVASRSFRKTVLDAIDSIRQDPDMIYFHLKSVIDELRVRRKAKAVNVPGATEQKQLTTSTAETEVKSNNETEKLNVTLSFNEGPKSISDNESCSQTPPVTNKRLDEQIRKLNRALYVLKRKIETLEQAEVDLNDDDSSYLQVERFKKRACQIYEKICDLTGESKNAHRLVRQAIQFKDTQYPQFNKTVQAYINQTREFPDYHDVLHMLEHCNTKCNLGLASFEMKRIAHDAFTKVGKLLQARRKTDLYETVTHFTANAEDPAAEDAELAAKLSENQKKQKKISDVIEKYAREQDLTAEEQREARLKEKQQKLAEANAARKTAEATTSSKAADTISKAAISTAAETDYNMEVDVADAGNDDDNDVDADDDVEDEDEEDDDEEEDDDDGVPDLMADSYDDDDVHVVENFANGEISDDESIAEELGVFLTPKSEIGATEATRSTSVNATTSTSVNATTSHHKDEELDDSLIIIGEDQLLSPMLTSASSSLSFSSNATSPQKSKLNLDAFLDANDDDLMQNTASAKALRLANNILNEKNTPTTNTLPTTIVDLDEWPTTTETLTLEDLLEADIASTPAAQINAVNRKSKNINNNNNKRIKTGNTNYNNNNVPTTTAAAAAATTTTTLVPNGRVKIQDNTLKTTTATTTTTLKITSVSSLQQQNYNNNPKLMPISSSDGGGGGALPTTTTTNYLRTKNSNTEIVISDEES